MHFSCPFDRETSVRWRTTPPATIPDQIVVQRHISYAALQTGIGAFTPPLDVPRDGRGLPADKVRSTGIQSSPKKE
jgi:hypothetical protein